MLYLQCKVDFHTGPGKKKKGKKRKIDYLCTYQWYAPPPPPGDRWGKGGDLTNQEWLIPH